MGTVTHMVSSSSQSQTLYKFIKTSRNEMRNVPNQNASPFRPLYPAVTAQYASQWEISFTFHHLRVLS